MYTLGNPQIPCADCGSLGSLQTLMYSLEPFITPQTLWEAQIPWNPGYNL